MTLKTTINTDFIRKHPAQAVLTGLGLSGVVLVLLPLDGDVPLDQELKRLLPFFISAGYLRWVLTGELSRWEGWLGYALALIVVVLFSLLIIQLWWELEMRGFLALLALGLGAGIWFVIQNLRHGASPTLTALVAMQLAYLPFALSGVVFFIGAYGDMFDIPIGPYLAFVTGLVYTAQAVLSVRGQPRLWLRLLPLGLVWAGGLTAGFLALVWAGLLV